MKHLSLLLPAFALLATPLAAVDQSAPVATPGAESSRPAKPAGKPWKQHEGRPGGGGHALAKLTPEERARFEAAKEKAVMDPGVVGAMDDRRAASQDMSEAERTAVLKADPSLAPIVEKKMKNRAAQLPPDEARKLGEARRAAQSDPAVRKAAEVNQKAVANLRAAMQKAMLAADPTLGPVLDKVKDEMRALEPRDPMKGGRKGDKDGKKGGGLKKEPAPAASPSPEMMEQ